VQKDKFDIKGMNCSACSSHIEQEVSKLKGVKEVRVNLLQNNMLVEYDPEETNVEQIEETVSKAGYKAFVIKKENKSEERKQEKGSYYRNKTKIRLIVSVSCWIPLFYLAMAPMVNIPVPSTFIGEKNLLLYSFTQFLLTIPIVLVNYSYYRNGLKALFKKAPNMDTLVAIGSGVAFLYGIYVLLQLMYGFGHGNVEIIHRYSHELYLESAATILTLITLGKYLEDKSKGRTSAAIDKLIRLLPDTAVIERNGQEMEIPVEKIVAGDILVVRSGDRIVVDGIVTEGGGSVDESAITGESVPVYKQEGDEVISAGICNDGFFKFRATHVGEDTTLSKIIKLVEEASSSRAPIARLADKISRVFVPVVITIACLSVIIWLLVGYSFAFALSIGVSVLIISCPCALGLATPVAIMVGTGKGAENGILIKSAESLETLHKVQSVVLDKTGTVTKGRLEVSGIKVFGGLSENTFLTIAASMEKGSGHPLAQAIVTKALEEGVDLFPLESFKMLPGKGIEASFNGMIYYAGNESLMEQLNLPEPLSHYGEGLGQEGGSPLFFAEREKLLGIVVVQDTLKESSKEAIQRLRKMGEEIILLTGDNKHTAEIVGKELGIKNIISGVRPDGKEQEIVRLQSEGKVVAMVGDGINDAPSLARADVGIAIGAGMDIAIESADIVLVKNNLLDVVTAIRLSKAVIRNIKQNLFWAFIYNTIGIPLAAGIFYSGLGWKLNPMFAAAAMSLSSVCVVMNALRLRSFRAEKSTGETHNMIIPNENNMQTKKILIEGMSCSHCSGRVEKALNMLDGVNAHVDLQEHTAYVKLDKPVSDEILIKAITDAGYTVKSIE
jgi:Cu+-exporting ATPase